MRILVVEDEPRAAQMLAKGLREEAYAVDVVGDGARALYQLAITEYDAIILDVILPVQDGLMVCRELRKSASTMPVLMLTARDAVDARIAGLDSGADDYLTKPYDFRELLARLRAVMRRGRRPLTPPMIRIGSIALDTRARRAFRAGEVLTLTAREYALLEHLILHADEVVGRAAIAEHVWDSPCEPMSNVIDVLIQRLRRKIDKPGEPSLIVTRRGEGYMLSNRP
jgi:DNA-binding response OmpR family regulator